MYSLNSNIPPILHSPKPPLNWRTFVAASNLTCYTTNYPPSAIPDSTILICGKHDIQVTAKDFDTYWFQLGIIIIRFTLCMQILICGSAVPFVLDIWLHQTKVEEVREGCHQGYHTVTWIANAEMFQISKYRWPPEIDISYFTHAEIMHVLSLNGVTRFS